MRRTRVAVLASCLLAASVSVGGAALAAPTPAPVGTPPTAVITLPARAFAGIPVTLSGARSVPSISEWEWDLDGNGVYEHDSTSSPWISKAFTKGKHTVRLRVRNEAGLVATASKSFTVARTPTVPSEPVAPTALTAKADGTSINVTWHRALGTPALTYRVTAVGDGDTDPLYVPSNQPMRASFDDLVPDTYKIRVAGVNGAGTGPAAETTVEVLAKGAKPTLPSPSATPSIDPTGGTTATAPANTATASSSGDNKDLIGYAMIGAGAVVLVGALVAGLVSMRRRRSAA